MSVLFFKIVFFTSDNLYEGYSVRTQLSPIVVYWYSKIKPTGMIPGEKQLIPLIIFLF